MLVKAKTKRTGGKTVNCEFWTHENAMDLVNLVCVYMSKNIYIYIFLSVCVCVN